MQAVILAGGRGKRMEKLFPSMQKCMIPVAGKPSLQYQIEWLKKHDIRNIIISIGYKGEQIKDYFKDGKEFDVNITYVREKKPLGTSGALKRMKSFLRETFLVMFGDQIVKNVDFKSLYGVHLNTHAFATFLVHKDYHPEDSDRIKMDSTGKIIDFGKVKGLTNTAIFITKKRILDFIPAGKSDFSKDIIPKLIKKEDCYAHQAGGYVKDIGTPERYEEGLDHINGPYKIVFVYPNMFTAYAFSPAIQLLSAILKRKQIRTGLVHINNEHGVPDDNETIVQYIKSHSPKIIAFTSTSFEFERVMEIAKFVKKKFKNILLILGGPHATISPEDIKKTHFDAFCIGEGEKSFVKFVLKSKYDLPIENINSFWIRKGSKIKKNKPASITTNLDELPNLDLDIMDTKKLIKIRQGWFSISFSRGCPFECSYCINHLYKKIKGKNISMKQYLRKKKVINAISELEKIVRRFKNDLVVFNFDDDLMMLSETWMKNFCETYKRRIYRKYGIQYAINARVNTLNRVMVKALKESGCKEVRIGVESGSSRIRYDILNKPITRGEIINAFYNCRKVDLRTNAFVMIGIPTETRQEIFETMALIIRIKPNLMRLSILYPYKHTKIYDYCKQNNLFRRTSNLHDVFSDTSLKFKDLSRDDIVRYRMIFPWYLNQFMYHAQIYTDLIKKYENYPAEELFQMEEQIRKDDEKADKKFRFPHFRFFKGNPYYFEYTK